MKIITQKLRHILSKSQLILSKFSGNLSVKGGKPLLKHLLKVVKVIVLVMNPSWVRLTIILTRRMAEIYKSQGPKGFVKTMKTLSVITQQSVAGYRLDDITSLGPRVSRTKGGLPRILPSGARKEIRLGNPLMIKWALTMFATFRVVEYGSVPKIDTISTPFGGTYETIDKFNKIIARVIKRFIPQHYWFKPLRSILPKANLSTSPNSYWKFGEYSTHPKALIRSYLALRFHPKVEQALMELTDYIPMDINFIKLMKHKEEITDFFLHNWFGKITQFWPTKVDDLLASRLGKLGFKQEPAGKVRIFAMVDPITQWVLEPLHKWIFSILRRIPMDGTFDQMKPLNRVPFGIPLYSFDLTAATDRLPIQIQKSILSARFGKAFSEA